MKYRLSVNVDDVARQVGKRVSDIRARVTDEMEKLSISTHAFVVAKAQAELNDFLRGAFLGKDNKNVRWSKIGNNIWAVEIDESVRWIEEGRPSMFMRWLIDKNPKAKTAKDGSRYAYIPFSHAKNTKRNDAGNNPKAAYEAIVKKTLDDNRISLRKIEKNPDGSPKMGVLHKVSVPEPGSRDQFPGLFSTPRPLDVAKRVGLQPHEGIFHLKGLMVTQRPGKKPGSVVREAITIRTISTKYEAEGNRWMYPEVKALGALPAAHEHAQKQWATIVDMIKRDLG